MVYLWVKKVKRISLFFLLIAVSLSSKSQNWLAGAGGTTNDEALDVAIDGSGSYYATGYFTTTVHFGSTILTSHGNSDIFIAKYNASGGVQWAINAGGTGADRAYSIKTDDSGNIYITGFYYGTATFGSTSISSVGNSQDVFIAKYTSNGTLLWVKSVGGSESETGYGITSDHAGNVIVTGQFKGTATFGSSTFSSMVAPSTGLPSFDIFTAKYDANGNFIWAKQGKAKYDDRALDVAVDASNNIFIVGQFSDTVQFDAIHNNAVANSGYLMKYDQNGNEQWFVKMSAQQTIVYSLAVDPSNNIFITGDYKGNLGIFTSPVVFNTSAFTNKIFIAKFSNSGAVVWVENDGSDSEVSSKSIALDANGDPYISGVFKCRFDEYSQTYGTGIFYSSGYRDVFITKYSSAGSRQWFKQFGSNKDDYCSGIAVKVIDKPVIAGSFENYFNVPASPAFITTSGNSNNPVYNNGFNYCSNSNYQRFIGQPSRGQKDIFISSPVDAAQAPFDYFTRPSSACVQSLLFPCIDNCEDTVHACGSTKLYANLFELDTTQIGALYNFLWSTGATTSHTAPIVTAGDYWLKSSRRDGCFQDLDTIHVAIHPVPPAPWITDSYSINVNQPPSTDSITVCGPDNITLWGTHAISDSVSWSGTVPFSTIDDSTISVSQSGHFSFNVFTSFGCTSHNNIDIEIQSPIIGSAPIDPHIVFLDSALQASDTIRICASQGLYAKLIDSAYYAANGGFIPDRQLAWSISPTGGVSYPTPTPTNLTAQINIPSTGWYTLYDTIKGISNSCGIDTFRYVVTRSFYVVVNPNPVVSLHITGPTDVCPNDSVTLYATSNISSFTWNGPSIIHNYHDSVTVMTPSLTDDIYGIYAFVVDSVTGCSTTATDTFLLHLRPYPVVASLPADGIVCPNDSLLLTCEPGIAYYWIGPGGDSIGTTQNIYVSIPGYYHCIQTSFDGCIQTSNFVEAKEYNTPYLLVEPGNHICANGNAVISVQASNSALVQWQPPLSGNALSQTVSAAGTYICQITQCGITTIDSVVIVQSATPSFITAADSSICPGDTLLLNANSGMISYEWLSQGSNDDFLYITEPGSYILQTTDADGCFGFSAPFVVTTKPQPPPPVASDTTVCAGQNISMQATSVSPVLWYTDENAITPVYTGNSYTTPVITGNTTYYLQAYDAVCGSAITNVHINVFSSSLKPSFSGDTSLCTGESSTFIADTIAGLTYLWTGPAGFTSGLYSADLISATAVNQGYYTLQASDANCISPPDSFFVFVSDPPAPHISPDTTIYICAGGTATLQIDSSYSSYSWSPGNQTTQSISVSSGGTFYATVTQNGCPGVSNSVTVSVNNPSNNPVTSDVSACTGTSATLSASGTGTLTWFNSSSDSVGIGNTFIIPNVDSSTVYYVQSINPAGCSSQLVPVNVIAVQNTIPPDVSATSPVCEGGDIYLYTDPFPGVTYSWTGPNGFTSASSAPVIFSAQTASAGTYQLVISLSGCVTPAGSVNVIVNPLPAIPAISGDTVYCENDTINLEVSPQTDIAYFWSSSSGITSDSSFFTYAPASTAGSGTYYLYLEKNGCYNYTSFNVTLKDTPTASIYSNGPVCAGDTLTLSSAASPGVTFYWQGPNSFSSTDSSNIFLNATASMSGTYELAVTLNGCTSDTAQLVVDVVNQPVIDLGSDTAFCSGNSVTFTLPSIYSYLWQDGSALNSFTMADSGKVIVTAFAGPGCSTVDSILVDNYHCLSNIPNIITPNGDGVNDNLYFDTEGLRAIDCTIYDRWGVIIYHWSELNGYWNGRDLKNTPVITGVYFYVVKVTDYDNKDLKYKGFVQVQNQ